MTHAPGITEGRTDGLVRARVDGLFATMMGSATMGVVGAFVAASALWSPTTRSGAIAFVAATVVLLIARCALAWRYRRHKGAVTIAWAWVATGLAGTAGVVWGCAIAWATATGNDAQILVVTSIALGAVMMSITNIVFWPAFFAFQAPVVLIGAIGFCLSGRPGHIQIGIAALILCIPMTVIGRRLANRVVRAMQLAAQNEELAVRLRDQSDALRHANHELEILSRTDSLTGLANRRCFTDTLEREWARAARSGGWIALLAIDVDHFKDYNDRHGHAAGDECLKAVAAALKTCARSDVDLAARPGGEEFALILPDADPATATMVAERMRVAVITHSSVIAGVARKAATVSIGVAAIPPIDGGNARTLLAEADDALYRAKNAGRNKVILAHGAAEDRMMTAPGQRPGAQAQRSN